MKFFAVSLILLFAGLVPSRATAGRLEGLQAFLGLCTGKGVTLSPETELFDRISREEPDRVLRDKGIFAANMDSAAKKEPIILLRPDEIAKLPKGTVLWSFKGDKRTLGVDLTVEEAARGANRGVSFYGVRRNPTSLWLRNTFGPKQNDEDPYRRLSEAYPHRVIRDHGMIGAMTMDLSPNKEPILLLYPNEVAKLPKGQVLWAYSGEKRVLGEDLTVRQAAATTARKGSTTFYGLRPKEFDTQPSLPDQQVRLRTKLERTPNDPFESLRISNPDRVLTANLTVGAMAMDMTSGEGPFILLKEDEVRQLPKGTVLWSFDGEKKILGVDLTVEEALNTSNRGITFYGLRPKEHDTEPGLPSLDVRSFRKLVATSPDPYRNFAIAYPERAGAIFRLTADEMALLPHGTPLWTITGEKKILGVDITTEEAARRRGTDGLSLFGLRPKAAY